MTTETPDSVSQEAFDRVSRERDSLKAQAAEAVKAFNDVKVERRLTEHFSAKGYANPLAVAARALTDFREVADEQFVAKAEEWYETQRKLFAMPTGEPAEPASTPSPASPWAQAAPNPIPRGSKVGAGEPLVAGTPAYMAWQQGKTWDQIKSALSAGDVVIPDKVKTAQRSSLLG